MSGHTPDIDLDASIDRLGDSIRDLLAERDRLRAVNAQLVAAIQNLMNGISTGAVRLDSDEDERYANAIRQINAALAAAREE